MSKRKKRVLIVDDDHTLTALVKLRLEEESPFHVWTENLSFRGVLAARMFRPDVVLLDINMPGIDGCEVAAQFKKDKDLSEVPIIFYTGLAESGQEGGVSSERFLSKTADWPEVMRCLNEALEEAVA